jgi:predicted nucleic acid-binding protein
LSTVIDASVLVAALVEIVAGGGLYAPELAFAEARNVLRRLERGGQLTSAEGSVAYEELLELDIQLFSFPPFAERAWELRHHVTCYDAWYVAIAEAMRLPLATLDRRLTRARGPTCAFLTPRG